MIPTGHHEHTSAAGETTLLFGSRHGRQTLPLPPPPSPKPLPPKPRLPGDFVHSVGNERLLAWPLGVQRGGSTPSVGVPSGNPSNQPTMEHGEKPLIRRPRKLLELPACLSIQRTRGLFHVHAQEKPTNHMSEFPTPGLTAGPKIRHISRATV